MEVDTIKNEVDIIKNEVDTIKNEVPNADENISFKLGVCEVCAVETAKYTCPRCEVRTCCLKCSNIHKKELECDGNRDRTKFVPLNKYSNLDLSSDYRFLEEITRSLEACKRKFKRNDTLPPHLYKLKKSCLRRRITLSFLPQNFQRRKRNTTKLNFKTDVIFWQIEWVFTNADNLRLHDEQVRETEKISSILNKYLVKQEDASLQEKLQYYQAADLPGIRVLLRAELKAGRKFYELDPLLSLKENLEGKTIIEFPVIHVVLKEHVDGMIVVDSDDEDVDVKKEDIIANIIKKSESEDSINLSLKNLLFLSDEEVSD